MNYAEDIDLKREIGKRIREVRGKLKAKDLAESLGIHKDQWSRYERGESLPGPEIRKKIDRYGQGLGYPPGWLYGARRSHYEIHAVSDTVRFNENLIDNFFEILESGDDEGIRAIRLLIDALVRVIRSKKVDIIEGKGG